MKRAKWAPSKTHKGGPHVQAQNPTPAAAFGSSSVWTPDHDGMSHDGDTQSCRDQQDTNAANVGDRNTWLVCLHQGQQLGVATYDKLSNQVRR